MPKVVLGWLGAGCLALLIGAAGCGDDTAGVPPDAPGGSGGGGMGGHGGMGGAGGVGGGGAGGMAGAGGGGTGGSGGADAMIDAAPDAAIDAAIDAEIDAAIDAQIDAEVDAAIDASPDAYVPACGNGILDTQTGELCDTGIASGPGACPTSCPTSTDPCTVIQLVNAGTCQAQCQTTVITQFINNDGCCPNVAGASFAVDNDCPSVCGNGFVEPGETCDVAIGSGNAGACPTNCDDGEPCTVDALVDGGTCTAHCTHTIITTIGPADGCCPAGADSTSDPDCSPGCGDGILQAGELCDIAIAAGNPGACPTSCTPASVCFDAALVSAGTCQAHCAQTPIAGRSCSDGNVCNGGETCDAAGVCQLGAPLSCGDNNPCTADSCDPIAGCQHANLLGGGITGCDDGNACNGVEQCSVGSSGVASCQPGTALVCNDGNVCTDDSCNPASGCVHTGVVGRSCSDGNACNGTEICAADGICQPGTNLVCNDGNPCTADTCDAASGCVFTNLSAGTLCSDGNACNGVETCNGAGGCVAGTPPVCNDGNPCTADTCNAAAPLGQNPCSHTNLPSGTSCDDNTVCNGHETCNGVGICQTGSAPSCNDGNTCTFDSCDPVLGCQHMALVGTGCVPTNACAAAGMCDASGACVAQGAMVCNDSNPCTADSCDPQTGCSFVNVANGTSCSSDPCAPAACQGGACSPGTPPNCDDGNPCTVDTCQTGVGCAHNAAAANGTSCSNDFCNPASCNNGSCVAGTPPTCDDGNPCTADGCASGGCFANPLAFGTSCGDGNACNGNEICDAFGQCQPGVPLNCNDGNPCTTDSCDPATGCAQVPLADGTQVAGCTDANACNGVETCVNGACAPGTPPADCGNCQSCISDSATSHHCGPRDQDGDGYPDCGCVTNPGTVTCNGSTVANCDCNDIDPAVHPCAPEICDGKDNDCNGSIDPNFRSFRQPCTTGADCCSGVCNPDPTNGQLRCDVGGNQCKPANDVCQSSSQCCSGDCAAIPGGTEVCAPTGGCFGSGAACVRSWDCCSLYCDATGHCSTGQICSVVATSCTTNAECCDDNCVGPAGAKTCQPTSSGGCLTIGELCTSGGGCCSNDCFNGRCFFASACQAAGDLCITNSDCCDSHCDPATQRCDTLGSCQPSGEPCSISGSRNCCSNLCVYNGIGSGVCLTLNGCSPDGEICNTSNDCCGFRCSTPDSLGLKRCLNPPGCQPPGEVCGGQGATQNCCCPSGQTCCRGTITGVERCFGQPSNACLPVTCTSANQCAVGFACTSNNQCPTGMTCNLSAGKCTYGGCLADGKCPCRFDDECCAGNAGRQCLPDPTSPTGRSCSNVCVPAGSNCTADSDCCSGACVGGVCASPPDAGTTCTPVGGPCQVTSQCCFGSCISGTCQLGGGF